MTTAVEALSGAPIPRSVRDESGRELSLRDLSALDRLRLFKAVGPSLSQNTAYLGMAMLAMSVTAVDGVPIPAATTEAQIEAIVAKLGDSGIAAVADALAGVDEQVMDGTHLGN